MVATKVELFDTGLSCIGEWRAARTSNITWNSFLAGKTKVGTYQVELQIGYEMRIFVPDNLNPYDYARITDTEGRTYGYHVVEAVPAGSQVSGSSGLDRVTLRADPLWVRDDPDGVIYSRVLLRGHVTGIGHASDLTAETGDMVSVTGGVAPAQNADELKTVVDVSGGVRIYVLFSGSSSLLFGEHKVVGALFNPVNEQIRDFVLRIRDIAYAPAADVRYDDENEGFSYLTNLKIEGMWFVPLIVANKLKTKQGTEGTVLSDGTHKIPLSFIYATGYRDSSAVIPINFKMRKNSVYRIGNQLRSLPIPTVGDAHTRNDYVTVQVACEPECGVFSVLLTHGGDTIDIADSLSVPSYQKPSAQERALDQIQRGISTLTPVVAFAAAKTSPTALLVGAASLSQAASAAISTPESAKPLPGMGSLALDVPQYVEHEGGLWKVVNDVGGLAWMRYEDRAINANPNTPWIVDRYLDGTKYISTGTDELYVVGDLVNLKAYRHYPQSDDDARAAFQQGVCYGL